MTEKKTNTGDLKGGVETAIERQNIFIHFIKSVCKEGVHYGVIPGTKKPTLFKPGAEALLKLFNLTCSLEETKSETDYNTGLIDYEYKALIIADGVIIAEGVGACNSFEDKYYFTNWQRAKEPDVTIQFEKKKQGTGAKRKNWNKAANQYEWSWFERGIKSPAQILGQKNTIMKMAKKRAYVDGALTATGASEYFTQDIESLKVLPDTASIIIELQDVVKLSIDMVTNRPLLERLFKAAPSIHGNDDIIELFSKKSDELK